MINVVYSTEHWIVPHIVMGVLVVLLVAIFISEGLARVKKGESFIGKPGSFFIEHPDYFKLFGTLVLFAAYIKLLEVIGFTVCSIIFVFLFNILYAGTSKKSVIISIIISVVSCVAIALLFGVAFRITLPSGICTIVIRSLGITIY